MKIILRELIENSCVVYIDDILIYGKNLKEHDENVEKVRRKLEKYNLKKNTKKKVYRKKKVEFLKFKIQKRKVTPTLKRPQGILEYGKPNTRKKVRRFLSIVNYNKIFIEKLSEIAKPLYGLLAKETSFK